MIERLYELKETKPNGEVRYIEKSWRFNYIRVCKEVMEHDHPDRQYEIIVVSFE